MAEVASIRYRAFLSYSHRDAAWAKWLHKALEGYRLDKDLLGRDTPLGPVPKTLRPIFRDREDFSGGHTLTDATVAALDASAALVVICSQVAATRPAVDEEVRLFRSRHPQRPVIPVIVDGTAPDNFPPALRSELAPDGSITDRPLTVLGPDLREDGDGRSLGLAKVIAGLTGLATDEIFRRAERERRRVRRWWIVGTTVTMAIIVFSAVWAVLERSRAEEELARFNNFYSLATEFKTFEVADETAGWFDGQTLAEQTLDAARRLVRTSRGFGIKILWFDSNPSLSEEAKEKFRNGMRGIGVQIHEETDIARAKSALRDKFDVVIANYGSTADKFAYQLLSEVENLKLSTPVVIYSESRNQNYSREAICYGAVARTTEIGTLYSAVIRAVAGMASISDEPREQCLARASRPVLLPCPRWANEGICQAHIGADQPLPK